MGAEPLSAFRDGNVRLAGASLEHQLIAVTRNTVDLERRGVRRFDAWTGK